MLIFDPQFPDITKIDFRANFDFRTNFDFQANFNFRANVNFRENFDLTVILTRQLTNYILAGATITASTTCGQAKTADFYCKIFFNDCNYCLSSSPNATRRHPIENVIDGRESYWMSPPLSRGQEYQRVNITIDLHQVRLF